MAWARCAVMLGGFGDGGQRGVAVPGLGLPDGQVVQRRGEAGQVGGGVGLGQVAVDLDGFGDGGQRGVAVPGLGLPDGQVVQRHGEAGQVGGGVGLGQVAVDARRLR